MAGVVTCCGERRAGGLRAQRSRPRNHLMAAYLPVQWHMKIPRRPGSTFVGSGAARGAREMVDPGGLRWILEGAFVYVITIPRNAG